MHDSHSTTPQVMQMEEFDWMTVFNPSLSHFTSLLTSEDPNPKLNPNKL